MEKDADRKLDEILAKAVTAALTDGPVDVLDLVAKVIADNRDFCRTIRHDAFIGFLAVRTRMVLRQALSPAEDRQLPLEFEPIPDHPDAPPVIVVKRRYGSPLKFNREDVEYWLRWATARAKGIDERNKTDKKAIREVAKMKTEARPFWTGESEKTLEAALDAKREYQETPVGRMRRERAQKAGQTGGRGRTKNQ